MKVLFLRSWYSSPITARFSGLAEVGVGGTELQLLLHARAVRDLGHEVVVLGVSDHLSVEEGVRFEPTINPHTTKETIYRHRDADVVLVNVTQNLGLLRSLLPDAVVVQVCQNGPALQFHRYIDLFAFVGAGQFARYCSLHRRLRHKFFLLPNVAPMVTYYNDLPETRQQEDQVVWVGGFGKQGLRQWGKAMAPVLARRPTLRWLLCGPSYDHLRRGEMPPPLVGLRLPSTRVRAVNLPVRTLAIELSRSLMLLASLGGEDGPVSYLDGHAAGIPVLCADDVVGTFATPYGTGIRCADVNDCRRAIEWLLDHPAESRELGRIGREFVLLNFTEEHQAAYLSALLAFCQFRGRGIPLRDRPQSDRKGSLRYYAERAELRLAELANRHLRLR